MPTQDVKTMFCLFCVLCSAEKDTSQSLLNNDSAHNLKRRDRQRFFEDVYQHDVDNYLPSVHLQIDCRKRELMSIFQLQKLWFRLS